MITEIKDLIGKTFAKVERVGNEEIIFTGINSEDFKMLHRQDCCETVSIEDVCGDLHDLENSPILRADETTNSDNPIPQDIPDESFTWTFFNISTVKGSVTIRWFGSSNGYYSESAEIIQTTRSGK